MNERDRHGAGNQRAVMIYDGTCGFCKFWIERWRHRTKDRINYRTYQEAGRDFPQIPPEDFERAVQLVEPDGHVTSGADAVFRAMEFAGLRAWWPRTGLFIAVARGVYRFIAKHRAFFSWMTRLLLGRDPRRPTYLVARWVFIRLLGAVYLFAFLSLALQIRGLIGKRGILPADQFLQHMRGQIGVERYWLLPTAAWINSSDVALVGMCLAGMVLSVAVLFGFAPSISLLVMWALYLSLVTICRIFLGFQWDVLLLETGLLGLFSVSPLAWRPAWHRESHSEKLARWLLLWLLFRLTFESGVVKLASGDKTWWDLTALTYHYQTQPLPLWTSWYANQAPLWFHRASCAVMFALELAAPFAVFGPRNVRRVGAGSMIALQAAIAATGNYCFFNLLTAGLCLLLFDEDVWPRRLRRLVEAGKGTSRLSWSLWLVASLAAISVSITSVQLMAVLRLRSRWPQPIAWLHQKLSPLRSFNSYGLFAVMTTTRPEIIIEGSRDGEQWEAYEFKWKPGDLQRRPGLVAPLQPRLDWQMWFAALGSVRENNWFISFLARLLEGSAEVLSLLERNPFPDAPPRYVRAVLYNYKFTRFGDDPRAWWKRSYTGLYCPALYLAGEGELRVR